MNEHDQQYLVTLVRTYGDQREDAGMSWADPQSRDLQYDTYCDKAADALRDIIDFLSRMEQ